MIIVWLLLVLLAAVAVSRLLRKSPQPLNLDELAGYLRRSVVDLEIPPNTYAIIYIDTDMGSITGGLPDRSPQIASTFEEALRLASDNGDEEQVGIFNSEKRLILWRYGWERFIYPDDKTHVLSRDHPNRRA